MFAHVDTWMGFQIVNEIAFFIYFDELKKGTRGKREKKNR